MLKELLQITEAEQAVAPQIAKYVSRTTKALKTELKSFMYGKEKVEVKQESPTEFRFTIHFNRFHDPIAIKDINQEFKLAIKKADVEGHIKSIEIGNGHGDEFVEALLTGLRPGMKVIAEAFFPTVEYVVTWHQVTSRPKR